MPANFKVRVDTDDPMI